MERRGRKPAGKAVRRTSHWFRRFVLLAFLAAGGVCAYYALDDRAPVHSSVEAHFKYGSTGAERAFGMPYAVWMALPELFPEYLPARGGGYASLGFIYERDQVLPIGVSERSLHGMRRVALNCGGCHVGSVRETAQSPARVVVGMPANTLDLGALQNFLFQAAADARFTPDEILAQIDRMGLPLGWLERVRLRFREVYLLREQLLMIRQRLAYSEVQPRVGPGRFDATTAIKAFFRMPLGEAYKRTVGTVDVPSVWQMQARDGRSLTWGGSNDSMSELVWLGAVHTGAVGDSADTASIERIRSYLSTEPPPEYPMRNPSSERFERGRALYESRCAECHGRSGRDLNGPEVGKVAPLKLVRTDPNAARTYTAELAGRMNALQVADRPPMMQFRKQEPEGYTNVPLDGLWLRGPYLHNGSVPTVRDLLEPARNRPTLFYRGYDVIDEERMGFVSNVPEAEGRRFFAFYTGLAGNSNDGHDGPRFGTDLPPRDKDALVEYLKSF
jgi:hypothetical protein